MAQMQGFVGVWAAEFNHCGRQCCIDRPASPVFTASQGVKEGLELVRGQN